MSDPRLYEFSIRWNDYGEAHAEVVIEPAHDARDGCDWHDDDTDYGPAWGYVLGVAARAAIGLCPGFGPFPEDDPRHFGYRGGLASCCGAPRGALLIESFDPEAPPSVYLDFPSESEPKALRLVRDAIAAVIAADATPTNTPVPTIKEHTNA